MKRKLLFAAVALLCSVGSWAANDFTNATYSDPYSVPISNYNFEDNLNGWTVEANNAGFYQHEGNGGHIAEIYNKKNAVHYINRTIPNLKAGHYRLYFLAGARGNTDTSKVYAYIGDEKKGVVGEPFASYVIDYDLASDGSVEIGLTTTADHAAEWVAIDNVELKYYGPTANYETALNKAYFTAGSNMTSFIRGADFGEGISCFPITSGTRWNTQTSKFALESWNNNNITYAQTIAIPNGKYRITVDMISGNATKEAYLFATSGGNTSKSSKVSAQSASGRDNYTNMCEDVAGNTLTIDNFSVTDGTLTIGVTDPSDGGWIVFDNFTLTLLTTDMTSMIANAAVTSTASWTNGRVTTGQQYTGAPDNTYLDTWNGTLDQYQEVVLPAGYYLLKCATRADATVPENPNIYVYSKKTSTNIASSTIHLEGASGNLLGNGWGWTYVPFTLTEETTVKIGFWSKCNSSKWAGADDFHLTFYSTELAMKQGHLAQVVSDANVWADKLTTTLALENALSASAPTCESVEECNTAISNLTTTIANARASEAAYATFNALKDAANAIAAVAYTETTSGSHATFVSAISTQTVEDATTTEAINTAISGLKAAIKAYIAGAEPLNEGEYFDITCLIENPSFENNNSTGWSGFTPNAVSYGCAEFFNMNFDFYQNLAGLANGSYQLTVQAYCRPGDNGNETSGAYYDYTQGINNITAELYVNSDASTIGNIYSYKSNTTAPKVDGNDFLCNISSDNYWVPNNMEGASLYFDDGAYVTKVAALVTDGNLKIGFREESKKTNQWVIFDNFKLYYYGSSKLIYYKQYLPQLRTEVSADLSNGAYANVLVSSEDETLDAALAANPASETESAYETVINNLKAAQVAFRAAATSYDALVAAKASSSLTKITSNIGTGVFQYNEATNNSLYNTYETIKGNVDGYTFTTSSTAAGAQALVDALNTAISNYENQTLNAPDASKRYYLTIVEDGKDWNGNAVTFIAGGRSDEGDYAIKYLTPANANYCQAIKFTATTGNRYKMSVVRADGYEQYLTTNSLAYGSNTAQIRTTTDASKALEVEIKATTTSGQFLLYNTEAEAVIANNNNNDMYTAYSANFTIAEASLANVTGTVKANKFGTVIFPFTPQAIEGVEFYSLSTVDDQNGRTQADLVEEPTANVPYLLRNTTGEDVSYNLSGWGLATQDSYTAELMTGVYTASTIPVGSYVLQTQNGKQAFYKVESDGFIATPYRAYMTKAASAVKAFFIDFDDTATGIDSMIESKSLLEGEAYDMSGRRVLNPTRGLYIINGKKVLLK